MNYMPVISEQYKHFDMFRLGVSQRRDLGAFSEFRWRVRTGAFINNLYVPYFDFFHFNSQPVNVLINDYDDAFMLPALLFIKHTGIFW